MPELPEVETIRRGMEKLFVGRTIAKVELYRAKNVETDPDVFIEVLKGKTITEIRRKGKLLLFVMPPYVMTSHLRMEGKYFFETSPGSLQKHDIFRFLFEDGHALVYNDVRKFGRVGLYPESEYETASSYSSLGPEPFEMTPMELYEAFRKRSGDVKEALMDQTLICGIGNIYADETLFATQIHPKTLCKSISLAQCESILLQCRRILGEAIEEGGSTIRSYHPDKGIDGRMQNRLYAYGHENEPCPRCGFKMKKFFLHGRGTTYCPRCQVNPNGPKVIGVTGPIHSGKSTASAYLARKFSATRFNADEVAKQAYFDREVKRAVKKLLGKDAYIGKEPNFPYIREKAANKPQLRRKLSAIIHPFVYRQAEKLIEETPAGSYVILDVPLLFPSRMDELCDETILVLADVIQRAKRLSDEGKDSETMLRLNAGYPVEEAKKKSSVVIYNNLDLESLYQSLDEAIA